MRAKKHIKLNKLALAVLALLLIGGQAWGMARRPPAVAFQDTFNSGFDAEKWQISDGVQERVAFATEGVAVGNGTCKLIASETADGFSSGSIWSIYARPYGRWVARIKMPTAGMGYWPAFWLVPSTYPASTVNMQTVLVAEWFGAWPDRVTVAYAENDGAAHYQNPWPQGDFAGEWHVYEAELRPTFCAIRIDGEEVFRWVGAIPPIPMRIVFDFAITDKQPAGPPDENTQFPAVFEIDYITVYE